MDFKTCTRCKESWPLDEYYLTRSTYRSKKTGELAYYRSSWCKCCHSEYGRRRYITDPAHRAHQIEQATARYEADPEAAQALMAAWKAANRNYNRAVDREAKRAKTIWSKINE